MEIDDSCLTTNSSDSDSDHFLQRPIEMRHKKRNKHALFQNITLCVHIVLLLFVVFILYLCFSEEVVLFTWHPALLSIGWSLLMTESILTLSDENYLTKSIPFRNKVLVHWTIQVIAIFFIISGFIIIYVNKNINNKSHFTTWHGLTGLISLLVNIPTCFSGILALYKVDVKKYVNPTISKCLHIVFGCVTFVFGTITIILGIYSGWFSRRSNFAAQIICSIAILFICGWVLSKPARNLYRMVKYR